MNQYFYLITVQTRTGPASLAGVTVWEHGKTRHEIFERICNDMAEKLKISRDTMPVLGFVLERNI